MVVKKVADGDVVERSGSGSWSTYFSSCAGGNLFVVSTRESDSLVS
jgi:hypothetical protein